MALLTVFTPTYNRAQTLPRLYASLVHQSDHAFEWVIVDDGSTDSTRELVRAWIQDGHIDIRYHYQSNRGKSSAHNVGVQMARGDLFTCVDSDDYLTTNAVELIHAGWARRAHHVGLLAFKQRTDGQPVTRFERAVATATLFDLYHSYRLRGDAMLIFSTAVLSQFAFPAFPGERFVPEAYLYDLVDTRGPLLVLPSYLYCCEYLTDGYTRNMARTLAANPRGCLAYLRNRLAVDRTIRQRLGDTIRYSAIALSSRDARPVRGAPFPLLAALTLPLGYLLYARRYRPYSQSAAQTSDDGADE